MRTDRRGMIRGGVGAVVAMAFGGATTGEASAQTYGRASKVEPGDNPPTLAACLPRLDWDPAERGPLLIVAPERAKIQGKVILRLSDIPPRAEHVAVGAEQVTAGRNGFRLAAIAPRYRRKLVAFGSLSTVVPDTMAVLRYTDLPEPDLFQGVSPEGRPQFLLATLSKSQWGHLLSEEGLGMGDLKREQQVMFAGLFPGTARLQRTDSPAPGENQPLTESVPLDGLNVASVRLRMYRELSWTYLTKNTKGGGTVAMGNNSMGSDIHEPIYRFQPVPEYAAVHRPNDEESEIVKNVSVFGVDLLEAQPNRAKPSDIDYGDPTWNAPVDITNVRTVGEVVSRVRAATGVEIYADKRYAGLSVFTRTAPSVGVRAGDLLKAVALSVTGTYRRVASGADMAFVLTDDRVGSGLRYARMNDWILNARQKIRDEQKRIGAATRESGVWDNLPWSSRRDMTPSPEFLEKRAAEAAARAANPSPPIPGDKAHEYLTPIADLPPGAQARIRSQLTFWNDSQARRDEADREYVHEKGVQVEFKPVLAAVLPNIGTVPLPTDASTLNDPGTPPVPFPEFAWYSVGATPPDMAASLPLRLESGWFQKRVLAVSVGSAEDAREAARVARSRRFNALLFPAGALPPKQIAEWVSAARKVAPELAVWLKMSIWRQNSVTGSDAAGQSGIAALLDRNVVGETYAESLRRPVLSPDGDYGAALFPHLDDSETGGYVAVGDKDALRAIRSRVLSVASASPDIAGIVFTDSTPPGYGVLNGGFATPPDRELGYAPASRLAFLREAGADPLDLSPFGELERHGWTPGMNPLQTRVRLPFFPDPGPVVHYAMTDGISATESAAKTLYPRWYEHRKDRLSAALESLRVDIRSALPKAELLIHLPHTWGGLTEWVSPAAAASATPKTGSVLNPEPVAQPDSLWLNCAYTPGTPPGFAPMNRSDRFARQVASSTGWLRNPDVKTKMPSTKFGLFLDLTRVPFADAEELLSRIVIAP